MADYTTTGLISNVRAYGMLPSYEEGSAANILRFLNTEQLTYLTKQLESTREQYRLTSLDITLTNGRLSYPLPTRAVTAGVQLLEVLDGSGNVWGLWELRPYDWPNRGTVASPCRRFFLKGTDIVFYAQPPAGTLRVWYPLRMSELVVAVTASPNYSTITAVNTGTNAVTVDTALAGTTFDLVRATPPFDILSMDAAGASVSTTITFAALPPSLAVGDYVCVPGRSPVCQVPLELHPLLCQHVAYVIQLSKGDPKAGATQALRDSTAKDVLALMQPRPQRTRSIVNRNAPGFWRWGLYGGNNRGGI